uniref:RNA-dependent RNA polymerase n=1 Tax=Hubei lepidoptera virus 5 TaxID=1922907 RepID=A0A1L3KNY8_9VIRU|nr:RNA-dependent RNA polymerase [Hubei lepidoptera virus 5]
MDALMEDIEDIFLKEAQKVVHHTLPLLKEYNMKWSESYWIDIINKHKIRMDLGLYRECVKYSKCVIPNPRQDFLDTYMIDESHPFHKVLMGRVSETMTFGLLKTFEWFNLFANLSNGRLKELQYIAGLVSKSGGSPFKVKRGDNSVVEDIKLFYNIQNIIECCLNICDLRFSLIRPQLCLYVSKPEGFKKYELSLDTVLDEIALRVPVSPKVICSNIKRYLTFVIRTGGAYAERQATFDHGSVTHSDRATTANLKRIDFNGREFFEPFMSTTMMKETEKEGKSMLAKYRLCKLQELLDVYMYTSLIKTDPSHFVAVSSFLHRLMSVSGFGRALNFSSSPRSAEPLDEDKHGLAEEIRNIILTLDREAIAHGMVPPTGEKWIPTCIASWKSTSAGISGIKAKVIINNKPTTVRISKKTAVGAYLGPKAFTRKMLAIKTSKLKPGSVGFRDVPYKPTRAIYVIPLPTLCAQVGTTSHIVDYASTRGKNGGLVTKPIDPSHFATGSGATSGIRVFDNQDTIKASGDMGSLALGNDLSSFDAHCVNWNFRRPILRALAEAGAGRVYGPESIPQVEMLEYAFGEGHIDGSFWDNGREPIVYVEEADLGHFSGLKQYIHKEKIGSIVARYRVLAGAPVISDQEVAIFDIDRAIECGENVPHRFLRVGVRMDGHDLVYLTSEASGEKTTLTANTAATLAMQRIALRALKTTRFGKVYNPIFQKGVGDDSEWIGTLGIVKDPAIIEEAVKLLQQTYSEMGHLFSPSKTFIIPLSAEFVQTFARFGLYLHRDQIPVIASEKPRDIRNPIAFLNSFKSVLLAKLARGMNPDYAYVLYYVHFRKITELILKRHGVKKGRKEGIRLDIPYLDGMQIHVSDDTYYVTSDKPTNIREEVRVFRFSTSLCYIPTVSGGGGLNPLLMGVVHSPAFFHQFIAMYDREFQKAMYATYVFMSNQPLNDGSGAEKNTSDKENRVRLTNEFTPFSIEQIFSHGVRKNLQSTSSIDIGRMDARRVPQQIMMNGVQMEKFMHVETNFVREEYAENFLKSMKKRLTKVLSLNDEWILNFKFIFCQDLELPKEHTFWVGLCDEYDFLLRTCGLSSLGSRMYGVTDRLRMIISRDPVLKSIRTPDEIISVLDKYGVTSQLDRDIGLVILTRMGFEHSVSNAILDLRFNSQDDVLTEKTYGMFSDDFLASLNIMTRDRMRDIGFPMGMDSLGIRLLHAYGSQLQVFYTFYHEKNFKLESVNDIVSHSDRSIAQKFTQVPRTLRKVIQSRRNKAGILLALCADLANSSNS